MTLIAVFYHILLFLGGSILLGGFTLGDEVIDLLGVDTKFSGCRVDDDIILDDGNE